MRALDYMNRVEAYLDRLNSERRSVLETIPQVRFLDLMQDGMPCAGYGKRECALSDCSSWPVFSCSDTWGGPDYHAVFAFTVTMKEEMQGRTIGFSLDTGADDIWNTDNPQIMVYVNGTLTCAMDLNHHEVILSDSAKQGDVYDIRLYAYVNSPGKSNFLYIKVFAKEPEAEALYYDMKLPLEAAKAMRPDDERGRKLLAILNQAGDLLDLRVRGSKEYRESLASASAWLQENLYEKDWGSDGPTVYALGHTHIDVAWKWPLRQTREKAVRSFSTVLYLMRRYPEYRFFLSQPQLYEYVKEEAPEIFEQVKERVQEGRWEADGAMWLESDCNLTSGESLIRQILYGKKFFKEEFGIDEQQILWLPDAFGFLGALPQIMKRSGIRYFLTTKMGWNDANQQPDDTFLWEGIDGSRVVGMYITTKNYETYPEHFPKPVREVTYNGRQNASQTMGTWQNYRNKDVNDAVLTIYGYGDGGGGPTEGMLEESRRLSHGILGVPKVKLASLKEYLSVLDEKLKGKELNTWYGDLYLEYHRKTFSSIAENKKNNRICENKNQEAEWLAALAWWMDREKDSYPKEKLDQAWKLLLLNQFHDILPGSAIEEVYEQSDRDYATIKELDEQIICDSLKALEGKNTGDSRGAIIVWNPLGFAAKQAIVLDKETLQSCGIESMDDLHFENAESEQLLSDGNLLVTAVLPAKGSLRLTAANGSKAGQRSEEELPFIRRGEHTLETPWYLVSWDEMGQLTSLFDKEADREIVKAGSAANEIIVYEDIPKDYDAWNVESYYTRKHWKMEVETPCCLTELGDVCAILHTRLSYQSSSLEQDIVFYSHTRRIDFKTKINWREQQQLVKAQFDLDIMTRTAACEIPYGVIERPTHQNTSWQRAQFEMCVHRFADLSEPGYGAALLNDSRYGYSIKDSSMGLTLLTSGIFPHPDADKGYHELTYALMPHMGDWRSAKVVQEAGLLNEKPILTGHSYMMSYSKCEVSAPNVIVTSVKRSENSNGLIVRMYEACGSRSHVQWNVSGLKPRQVWECSLMEQQEKMMEFDGQSVEFAIKPFEIKTFLLI